MENNFNEDKVQEILGIIKNSQTNNPVEIQPNNQSFDEDRVQQAMDALRGAKIENKKTSGKFSWPRFIAEKFAKGVLNLADIPQHIIEGYKDSLDPRTPLYPGHVPDYPGSEEFIKKKKENPYKPLISTAVKSVIDLDTQGEGNTPVQRIVGKGVEFAGGSLIPGGGLPGLAKNVALGGTIGAGAGSLEELNVPEPVAALTSLAAVLAGAPALKNAINNAIKKTPALSESEKRVANYLQKVLGEEGLAEVNKNIAEAPKYPVTNYESTTAEVANNPLVSTLHRLRQGIPGTGLQERAASQNKAIYEVSDRLSAGASKSSHIKEAVKDELASRQATKYSVTEPLYEKVRQDKTQLDPVNIKKFFEENKIVKGKKRKDLEGIKKLIEPSEKMTEVEAAELKNYESQVKSINESKMSASAKDKAISQLEKPKTNNPTIADLDEARQNMNDMMMDFKKSGQKNRARQLKEAIKALDEDLAKFPSQREATQKYAELSKPVNEILEHPKLKDIPESRVNNIFDGLFDSKSTDNMQALKKVFKDRPEDWKGVQDATVEYLMKNIKNAGSEGGRSVLSSHKLDKFLEKHEKALSEVLTNDQMKFLGELKNALKGRNIAETSGIEKQSATYGKLITGTNLNEGFGRKIVKGATYIPHVIPKVGKATGNILRDMLGNYVKNREADVMGVLDNFLKNPEYAPKLLNHKFKNQAEFNKEMNSILKLTTSTVASTKDKKEK